MKKLYLPLLMLMLAAWGSLPAQSICSPFSSLRSGDHLWDQACPDRGRSRQNKERFHVQIGAAAHYSQGLLSEAGSSAYAPSFTGWQGQGFVGLRLEAERRKRSNVLGVWGTLGFLPEGRLNSLLTLQGLPADVNPGSSGHEFREWEVGILFREWFRVSAGRGTQSYTDLNLDAREVDYYTATAGLSLKLTRSIKWNTTATVLFGDEFGQYTFRPATGLAFRFNGL